MSIYAANNILKGICNYDRNRVGGLIFNSRGDPEEELRVKKFSEAVGIPIVASFERSELFMTAEENGKTVVEMYPESDLAHRFRELADNVMAMKKYTSNFLGERELEMCILGRSVKKNDHKLAEKIDRTVRSKRRYITRNVLNDEPYGGCAFSGAAATCASIEGLATVMHSPLSCAQFSFQTVSCTYGRYKNYHIPIRNYADPCISCTAMKDSDMIFGGTEKLRKDIESVIAKGNDRIAVVTSCPSGIIGDDVKGVVDDIRIRYPEVKIALIEEDGNLKGDFMQGVIDMGIELCETFSKECEKTDTVNLVGTKSLALNNQNSVEVIEELLRSLGIGVNCLLPGCDSLDSVERISSAKLNLRMNPDVFTDQLCDYLQDRFGIGRCPIPIRPGIKGTLSWLGYIAEFFGRQDRFETVRKELIEEYDESISRYRKVLKGKRFCMLSATKDIDWIMEATEKVGMIRERTLIVERSDYSNDMEIQNDYDNIEIVRTLDVAKEREIIESISPDIVISTLPITSKYPHMPVPLVHVPSPFTGIDFVRRLAVMTVSRGQEGWRKDVV